MAKFRILSKFADGLPIADKLQEEGHDVDAYIEAGQEEEKGGSYKEIYDGIIEKVENPLDNLEKDRICIVDTTSLKYHNSAAEAERIAKIEEDNQEKFLELETMGDKLRSQGFKCIGGGKANDYLELDREFGQDIALEAGLKVPKHTELNDYKDAIAEVSKTKKRYILKPSGTGECYSLYPARSWEDLCIHLEDLIKKGIKADKVLLQEYVEGVQMGIEGWWDGNELHNFSSTFEHKRLMAGSTGPFTGETGSIIFKYPDEESKLVKEMKKIGKLLKEIKYPAGNIDGNFIHNAEGSWFLEWTPRQGYPSTYIELFAIDNWGEIYSSLANEKPVEFNWMPDKYVGGVLCFIPQFPYGKTEEKWVESPTPFSRVTESMLKNITFIDAKIKDNQIVTGGCYGHIMCVNAAGETPKEINLQALNIIKNLEVYPIGYRNDIGLDLDDDIAKLKSWGYWVP